MSCGGLIFLALDVTIKPKYSFANKLSPSIITEMEPLDTDILKELTVLYVEDDPQIRNEMGAFLKRRVRKVLMASNGKKGLQQLEAHKPDMVITDIRMPEMDGLKMSEIIKKKNRDLPIILTTAFDDTELLMKAIDIGIDKYIKKPIHMNTLIQEMYNCCKLYYMERTIKENELFLQEIIDGIEHPIMVIGTDYYVKLLNRVARESLPPGITDLNKITCHQISHNRDMPCDSKEHLCPLEEIQQTHRSTTVIHNHYLPNGESRICEIVASPLWKSDGTFNTFIESVHDITERKRAEESLHKQREQFISVLIHDLKGPLIPVLGYAGRLLSGKIKNEEQRDDALRIIEKSTKEVLKIIEMTSHDLRNKSSLDTVNLTDTELNQILFKVVINFAPLMESKKINLHINNKTVEEYNKIEKITLKADGKQLQSMIENLFGNAVKYAKSIITIDFKKVNSHIEFLITDDGPGIPDKYHKKIFDEYFQAPGSKKGTGIGLYSAKKVVENHKGEISIQSTPGEGTSFAITLPRGNE